MSFFPFPIHPLVLFSFLHSLSLSGHPFFTHYFDSQWLLSSTASFMCSETLLSLPTIASQHLEKWLAAKRSSMNCHSSVAKSSLTLQPWGLQHARIPSPPLSLGFCSNSCPLSQWCYPTISSSATPFFFFLPLIFPSIRVFSSELSLHIRWPQYWSLSFSISSSSEYPVLISFQWISAK